MKKIAFTKPLAVALLFLAVGNKSVAQITGIKINGDTCHNFTLDLQAEGTSNSPYFFWNFNDPNSGTNDTITLTGNSPSPFPTHTFTHAGVYNVCATFREPGQNVSMVCRTLAIGLCCNGTISSPDSCLKTNVAFTLTTGAVINSIAWDFGDPASGANNTSTALNPPHYFSAAGRYTVKATVHSPCGTFTDSLIRNIVQCIPPTCTAKILFSDSCIKSGAGFQINASYPVNAVTWNFDDPQGGNSNNTNIIAQHTFSATGTYNISAVVNLGCGLVTIYRTIRMVDCGDSAACKGSLLLTDSCAGLGAKFKILSPYTVNAVYWNFNDPLSGIANTANSISATHIFNNAGTYLVGAVVNLSCGSDTLLKTVTIVSCDSVINSLCNLYVPNAFTPNGDNKNEAFHAVATCAFSSYELLVFNRWGEVVYKTRNPADKWDGSCQNAKCPTGNYVYVINYQFTGQHPKIAKGSVLLLR